MVLESSQLKYFLTGGSNNTNPYLSLGGYGSNTEVATSGFDTLFGDVTTQAALSGDTTYRCIAVVNTGSSAAGEHLYDAHMWVEDDPNKWISIGYDYLSINASNGLEPNWTVWPYMAPAQTIADEHTEPLGVTWLDTCNPWTLTGAENGCNFLNLGTSLITTTIIYPPPRPNRTGTTLIGSSVEYLWIRRKIPAGSAPNANYTFSLRMVGMGQGALGT